MSLTAAENASSPTAPKTVIARTATSATTPENRTRHARLAPKAKPAPARAAWFPTATADANSDANFRRLRRANRVRITVQTARCRADAIFVRPAIQALNYLAALAVLKLVRRELHPTRDAPWGKKR